MIKCNGDNCEEFIDFDFFGYVLMIEKISRMLLRYNWNVINRLFYCPKCSIKLKKEAE